MNHYSSAIMIFLFPFTYVVIMMLSEKPLGAGIFIVTGICLPLSIVLYILQRRQLIFDVYGLQPRVTLGEFKETLKKLSNDQNWKLSIIDDTSDSELYFEIVTPTNILSWGCLLTIIPLKDGFKFRCINAVDYPLNQVIFSFGHRTYVKETFIAELLSHLGNSKIERIDGA